MSREVALAIGVGEAKPLDYLPGAVNGAEAFHVWASKLGYESTLLIDDEKAVTMDRLRSTLLELVTQDRPIHRLLLYFAGHGLIREAEEGLWLLSDWNKELRAVAVEVLKRRLSMYYNIEQIAIFADSCRSLPKGMDAADLVADAVIGRGPFQPQVPPPIDKFTAAQDGTATFVVPGASPKDDRCVFSGILMEGLWGMRPDAFSPSVKNTITSRSLGKYLQSEVPKLASRYGWKLVPNVYPTFPEGDDIYFPGGFSGSPPKFPDWPSPSDLLGLRQLLGDARASGIELSFEEEESDKAESQSEREDAGQTLLNEIRRQPRPEGFDSGFAVSGGSVRQLWTPSDVIAKRVGRENWWQVRMRAGHHLNRPVPVLIEFKDGMFAATTALPRFTASMFSDARGISALIYRPIFGPKNTAAIVEKALASMEDENLKVDSLADLAVGFRQAKHYDPVLGVISAYLYDSIGDIANIRRMACYYTLRGQAIPYDIALLAQLPGEWKDDRLWADVPPVGRQKPRTVSERKHCWTYEKTPASRGEVGGFWPWMRQGWTFLDDPVDINSTLIRPELLQLVRHLRRGRFAMLDAKGGRRLAKIFNLSQQVRKNTASTEEAAEASA